MYNNIQTICTVIQTQSPSPLRLHTKTSHREFSPKRAVLFRGRSSVLLGSFLQRRRRSDSETTQRQDAHKGCGSRLTLPSGGALSPAVTSSRSPQSLAFQSESRHQKLFPNEHTHGPLDFWRGKQTGDRRIQRTSNVLLVCKRGPPQTHTRGETLNNYNDGGFIGWSR